MGRLLGVEPKAATIPLTVAAQEEGMEVLQLQEAAGVGHSAPAALPRFSGRPRIKNINRETAVEARTLEKLHF